jgi:hypothetical protein
LIPQTEEFVEVSFSNAQYLVALVAAKTFHLSEFQRVEPEFGSIVVLGA